MNVLGEGNINQDPYFCDPNNGDFNLYGNSPCIGTGLDGANMGAFNIGCYLDAPLITINTTDEVVNTGDEMQINWDFSADTTVLETNII